MVKIASLPANARRWTPKQASGIFYLGLDLGNVVKRANKSIAAGTLNKAASIRINGESVALPARTRLEFDANEKLVCLTTDYAYRDASPEIVVNGLRLAKDSTANFYSSGALKMAYIAEDIVVGDHYLTAGSRVFLSEEGVVTRATAARGSIVGGRKLAFDADVCLDAEGELIPHSIDARLGLKIVKNYD